MFPTGVTHQPLWCETTCTSILQRLRDNLWKLALRGHLNTDFRARGSNSQPLDPEFDTLDRSATDPPVYTYIFNILLQTYIDFTTSDFKCTDMRWKYIFTYLLTSSGKAKENGDKDQKKPVKPEVVSFSSLVCIKISSFEPKKKEATNRMKQYPRTTIYFSLYQSQCKRQLTFFILFIVYLISLRIILAITGNLIIVISLW